MKITSKKMERGKRGPLKGDGGRPKDKLYNDPDRWIIVGALWYKKNPREQRSFAVLQALDNLSTQYDCIELARGTKVKDGIEYGALAIVNTADAYGFKGNRADRQSYPRLAESGSGCRALKICKPKSRGISGRG
jgi:hypothetical protein